MTIEQVLRSVNVLDSFLGVLPFQRPVLLSDKISVRSRARSGKIKQHRHQLSVPRDSRIIEGRQGRLISGDNVLMQGQLDSCCAHRQSSDPCSDNAATRRCETKVQGFGEIHPDPSKTELHWHSYSNGTGKRSISW